MQEKAAKNLVAENEELRVRLQEAQDTLDAIRRGEVDGLVVSTPKGEQVYTISGAERPYRALIEEMREGALMLSDDNTVLYANSGFAQMMRSPLEKIVGTKIEKLVSQTNATVLRELLSSVRKGNNAITKEITFTATDGSLVPTQASVNTLQTDTVHTAFLVLTDLTQHMNGEVKRYTQELELAQIALSESEQRWATTLSSIGDAVIATSTLGKITFMNRVAEDLTGWKFSEASGKPVQQIFRVINEFSRKTVENPVSKVLEKGMIVGLANHTVLIRKDATEVAIDDSGAPIKSKDGQTSGVVLVFRDITERRRIEAAIKKQASLIDLSPDATIAMNLEGIASFWSKGAETLYGWKKGEAVGKQIHLLLKTRFPEPFKNIVRKLEKEGFWAGELVQCSKSDKEITVDSRWLPLLDASGKIVEILKTNADVTERKKAEEATRISELRFRSLAENAPDVIMRFDTNLRVLYINGQVQVATGISPDKFVGRTNEEMGMPKELVQMWNDLFKKASASKQAQQVEFNFPSPIGIRTFDLRVVPEYGEDGMLTSFLGISRDVTERKQAEIELEKYRKELERLVEERTRKLELSSLYARNLIEASLDPLVTISVDGKITDLNKATELATGRSRTELIGSDFSNYFIDPEKARVGYKKVFAEGIIRDYPLAIRHRNGKVIDVLYNATVYRNAAGEIQGVFAAARDITEFRKAEEEAHEAAKKLKDAERLATIGATAGMVGHDIRNPLQAITGDIYLAKADVASMPESEEKQSLLESLSGIETNTQYINKIVTDLQDFVKPLNPQPERVNLTAVINELLRNTGIPANVKAKVQIEPEAEKVMADSDFVRRILANLISNAVQAMPNGGQLKIDAYHEGENIAISVEDSGVGIPEEVKSKLFTPLFTTKSKGQGFGLAVVKRLTEASGGTVTLESEKGQNTKFTVRLPRQRNKR